MIESISILISSGTLVKLKAFIVPSKNICYINQNKFDIDNSTIDRIIDILVTWKYEYGTSNILDAEEFTIIVYSDNKETRYHGKGIFPDTYDKFLEIFGGV